MLGNASARVRHLQEILDDQSLCADCGHFSEVVRCITILIRWSFLVAVLMLAHVALPLEAYPHLRLEAAGVRIHEVLLLNIDRFIGAQLARPENIVYHGLILYLLFSEEPQPLLSPLLICELLYEVLLLFVG